MLFVTVEWCNFIKMAEKNATKDGKLEEKPVNQDGGPSTSTDMKDKEGPDRRRDRSSSKSSRSSRSKKRSRRSSSSSSSSYSPRRSGSRHRSGRDYRRHRYLEIPCFHSLVHLSGG